MATIKEVFDEIAPGWYNYRHHTIFRTELENLAKKWHHGKLLNLGCGHGADFLPFKVGFELSGIDISGEMLNLARRYSQKYGFQVSLYQGDVSKLPYNNDSFDLAIAVATYHHLKGKALQLNALLELKRVLKPGGEAFITVWNRCQPRFWFKGSETMVPWRKDKRIILRYYRLFTFWELEKLVRQSGLTILESFPECSYRFPVKHFSRNICLVVKKV